MEVVSLELKRKMIELDRVVMAKKEIEFRIDERLDEITRLKSHIDAQIDAEKKLTEEIYLLKNNKKQE